jgi:hypothetical protein
MPTYIDLFVREDKPLDVAAKIRTNNGKVWVKMGPISFTFENKEQAIDVLTKALAEVIKSEYVEQP